MNICLKVGELGLTSEQLVAALVQYQLLEPLIAQIALDEVLKSVFLTQGELLQYLTGSDSTQQVDDFEDFLLGWLQQRQLSRSQFEFGIRRQLRLEKFKRLKFDSQLESAFLQYRSELDWVEFSLIQVSDAQLADELYFQLRDGEAQFAQLASQFSEGFERSTGGWVGPLKVSALPPPLPQLVYQYSAGVVHAPISIREKYWILRLERLVSARLTEATQTLLRDKLFANWLKATVQALVKRGQVAIGSETELIEQLQSSVSTS